jgi:hypothetical protein
MGPKVLLERINNLPTSPVEEGHEDTVSNLISWSFKILKDAEKQLLMQLSLFTGGFTPAAAGSVLGSADDAAARPVKDLPLQLDNLRRKSLLSCRQDSEDVRYSMLELIRTYCADEVVRTSSADHAAALRLRHARYFLGQMKELSARLYCDRGASMLMKDDLPNARSAMDWALSAGEDVLGAEVALALCPFFARHGYAGFGSRAKVIYRKPRADRSAALSSRLVRARSRRLPLCRALFERVDCVARPADRGGSRR